MMSNISVKTKITFLYISLMIMLVAIFLGVIFYISESHIINNEHENLKKIVNTAFQDINFYNDELEIDRDLNVVINNVHISVYDEEKNFIYGDLPLNFEYDDSFHEDGKIRIIRKGNRKWYIHDAKKNYDKYGDIWIRGISSASDAEKAIGLMVFISLAVFPFIIFFIGIIGYLVTKNAFKPIEKIRMAAERINEGNDLSQRINIGEGYDEIHTLANTFDTMFNRLQESFENEVRFTSDVSHELRTPISVIISQSEHGLEHIDSKERTEKSLKVILQESKKMSKLISRFLTLSRMDRGHQKLNIEVINLSELLNVVIENQKIEAEKKNIEIMPDIEENIFMEGDELMIMRFFINLISNAVFYNKRNGHVKICLNRKKNKVTGKISDNGIGISEENINKIWERFFQVDPSRTTDSSGLGLSMVKWIVEAHNGTISVISELGKGTMFIFEFPVNFKMSAF